MIIDFLPDTATQTFFFRVLCAGLVCVCGIELILSSRLIANRRLTWILYRGGILLLCYFGAAFIATIADDYLLRGIGFFSNLVKIVFWVVVWLRCRQLRVHLASDSVGDTGRNTLNKNFDGIIDAMIARKNELARLR